MGEKVMHYIDLWLDKVIGFLPTLFFGLLVFVIGFWVVRRIDKMLGRYFNRRNYEVSLQSFIRSLVNYGLKIIIIITVAGIIGLPTTSLVAVFGAAGLAIGLALQGSLANFAGGVLILLFKPFKVGDIITAQGESGEVKEIQIFNTILRTQDNRLVILPNGAVSNGTIINVSKMGSLKVDMKIKIELSEDIETVRQIILDILAKDERVLKEPAATVVVIDIFEGGSLIAIRPYAKVSDYWNVCNDTYVNIRKALIENNIKMYIPKQITFQE